MKSWLKKSKDKAADAPQAAPQNMAPQAAMGGQAQPGYYPQAGQPVMGGQIPPQIVHSQPYPQQHAPAHAHAGGPRPAPQGAPMPRPAPGAQPMRAPQPMAAPQQMGAPRPMMPPQPMRAPQPGGGMPAPQPQAMGGQPAPQYPPQPQAQYPQMQMPAAAPQIAMPMPDQGNRNEGERALPAITIHAFCDRQETAGVIQATTRDWRMKRTNLKLFMGGLPAAVEYYHNENTPSLVMIESGMRGQELFSQLESLANVCDQGTKVVVVGAANDIRLYRELMEKGVSDYIVPPFHPLTLIRSLSELYVDPDKPFIGRTCAFFGAKGGVGSSTLAHNMAHIMSARLTQETALVDLDASWGTTGLDFNYDSVQGLEEALASPDRLDETLLDRIMLRHSPTLSILPAAASLNNVGMDSQEAYEAVVDAVRKISPFSILDLPHQWNKWTSSVLKSSDEIVITAQPDLACLRNTKNLIEFLRSERPNDPDPIVILNKTGVPKTPEIPIKDFASALNIEPALVLPYEPVLYAQAANDGKMLSDMKGDSKAVEGLEFLAHRVRNGQSGAGPKKKSGGKSSGSSLIGKLIKKK